MPGARGRGAGGGLVPLGGIIAGWSFLLPYVRVLRVLGMSVMVSGPRIGGGLWLVPAIAVAILVAHFTIRSSSRRVRGFVEALGAILGLLLVAAVILRLHQRRGFLFVHLSAASFGVRPAVGWVLSLVGFTMVLVGSLSEMRRAG